MYAIIKDSGTQIKVREGETLDIDLRQGEVNAGDAVTFDQVLFVGNEADDAAATIGRPYVDGATVTAEVVKEIKSRKIDVIKFKRRTGYKRKQGHRQRYLRVKITSING